MIESGDIIVDKDTKLVLGYIVLYKDVLYTYGINDCYIKLDLYLNEFSNSVEIVKNDKVKNIINYIQEFKTELIKLGKKKKECENNIALEKNKLKYFLSNLKV